jgi:hypothetical protein
VDKKKPAITTIAVIEENIKKISLKAKTKKKSQKLKIKKNLETTLCRNG